jgi:N-acetylneuraminic acid mutarotase
MVVKTISAISIAAGVATALGYPSVSAQTWQSHTSMPTPRSEIYCAVRDNEITVAGGLGYFATVASCETYHPDSDQWMLCPALPKRLHHVAMASDDAFIYASGGYVSLTFRPDNDSSLWSLASSGKTWQQVSPLPLPIGEHTMVRVGSALYLIGGRANGGESDAVHRFDLNTKRWTIGASMRVARHSSAAVVVDRDVWILGGRNATHDSRMINVEIYDTKTDQWRDGPNLPVGRGGHSAVLLGRKIHVFGGEQFDPGEVLNRHDVFDLQTSRWRTEAAAPTPRHGTAACVVGSRAYVIGGATRPGLRTVFSVSDAVQSWSSR